MMTTGSVRGNVSRAHFGQWRFAPASRISLGPPQRPQNRAEECQFSRLPPCATCPSSTSGSKPCMASERRSMAFQGAGRGASISTASGMAMRGASPSYPSRTARSVCGVNAASSSRVSKPRGTSSNATITRPLAKPQNRAFGWAIASGRVLPSRASAQRSRRLPAKPVRAEISAAAKSPARKERDIIEGSMRHRARP